MNFADIVTSPEAEGKEKHVPFIEVGKGKGEGGADIVHVVVGKEVPHPNTAEHHIAWVELFGVTGGGQVIDLGRSAFAPTYTEPNVRFQVKVDDFKAFYAVSYCNIHGVWGNSLEV